MTTRRASNRLGIDCRNARDEIFASTRDTLDTETLKRGAAALAGEVVNLSGSEDFPRIFHRDAALRANKRQFGCYVRHVRKLSEKNRFATNNDSA
jgi:hypothetical protein